MTSTAATQAQFSLPTLNINGTNPRAIEDEYHQALKAFRIAEQLLIHCTCHGRDFQMQPRASFLKAREERELMLSHCQAIHDYLEQWYWNAVDHN